MYNGIVTNCSDGQQGIKDRSVQRSFFFALLPERRTGKQADQRIGYLKPVLLTEACWGAIDDKERVRIIEFSLDEIKKRGMGFVVHALHYSRVPDLHYASDGTVGVPGNCAFINKDGTLRKGHEIFNMY